MQNQDKFTSRIFSSNDYDLDCFELVDSGLFLFVTLKESKIDWEVLKKKIQSDISVGTIKCIAGALKTKSKSIPLKPSWIEPLHEIWINYQNLKFFCEAENVLNPGIFLDQTENRLEIKKYFNQNKKFKFLNLFSYTGVFSVFARSLEAETTSVDVSSRYLKIEKENQIKNGFDSGFRLIKEDVRKFLNKEIKRNNFYDCIVLDPPTFSRSDGIIFKVEKELFQLAEGCVKILNPKGLLLVSTNDANWDEKDFDSKAKLFAKEHYLKIAPGKLSKEYAEIKPKYGLKSRFFIK